MITVDARKSFLRDLLADKKYFNIFNFDNSKLFAAGSLDGLAFVPCKLAKAEFEAAKEAQTSPFAELQRLIKLLLMLNFILMQLCCL